MAFILFQPLTILRLKPRNKTNHLRFQGIERFLSSPDTFVASANRPLFHLVTNHGLQKMDCTHTDARPRTKTVEQIDHAN